MRVSLVPASVGELLLSSQTLFYAFKSLSTTLKSFLAEERGPGEPRRRLRLWGKRL